jgi:hypothetical protein
MDAKTEKISQYLEFNLPQAGILSAISNPVAAFQVKCGHQKHLIRFSFDLFETQSPDQLIAQMDQHGVCKLLAESPEEKAILITEFGCRITNT